MPASKNHRTSMDRAFDSLIVRKVCKFEADPKFAEFRKGWFVEWEGRNRRGFELPDAHLPKARLARADFTDAVLDRANLRGADLSQARLVRTSLVGADLTGANLDGADLTDANLDGAIGLPAAATA